MVESQGQLETKLWWLLKLNKLVVITYTMSMITHKRTVAMYYCSRRSRDDIHEQEV
jgi:hypothetical protein